MVYSRDHPEIKHVGLFGAVHQRALAQRGGYDDVLFTAPDGTISEIATSNIGFISESGQLVWPAADMLSGITMCLINQDRDEDVLSHTITVTDLAGYVGAVATNAATGVRTIAAVDDTAWSEHPLVAELRAHYESIPPEKI
ncbi:aminotransferase class IV [Nocardia takedensis]|uniref:aminotransferase class IV n=1 Tax=Nocardia takedensis TaxID=259390 RepID=UPI00031926C3|nr:aminotransferase class IV [Nocardia takedensis]